MLPSSRKQIYRVDEAEATAFVEDFHRENPGTGPAGPRVGEVRDQIRRTGTYRHTEPELTWGARVAWRNSSRCIGRLYWRGLRVRDRREVGTAAGVAAESVRHLAEATGGGNIRATITIFAPDGPDGPGPRIWNDQLIRYAGYPAAGGEVLGDPGNLALTDVARALGWEGGRGTPFDVLPLVVEAGQDPPALFTLPPEVVLEVPLHHPDHPWFARLGLRWYAVPAVSNMTLEIGGVSYPAAPFNGWYQGTEIGARNLGDQARYDLVPVLAGLLGLDQRKELSLWRDRAMVELNVAVLASFAAAGVTITDHHTESRRFLTHLDREERAGRVCPAEWSWIVPPISGSATPVFHRTYDEADLRPNFLHRQCPYGRGVDSGPHDRGP
ncbi:MAG: nitric oxide synthase oxygenase [Streptosporangiaceae bacterium]